MKRLKLLVVDDEPDIRLELQDFVEELGFECLLAANGQEALAVFKGSADIHIVLSDLMMPGLTGLELLERIVRDDDTKNRIRRFVFMTGNGDTRAVIDAMRLGASEFMLKPMDLDLLENILFEAREYVLAERFRQLSDQAREAQLAANEVEIDALNRGIRQASQSRWHVSRELPNIKILRLARILFESVPCSPTCPSWVVKEQRDASVGGTTCDGGGNARRFC